MREQSTRGARQSGAGNPFWKGGRTIASNGYVLLKMADHPSADSRGYVYEHRLVAERKIGRALRKGEIVHHINHDKTDNRPENLEVVANVAEHRRHHRELEKGLRLPNEANPLIACGCGCGTELPKYDNAGRPRRFVSGHNGRKASV